MSARPGSRPAPYYASSFVGRETELAQLRALIDGPEVSLVSITGAAGVGKTRLAATIAYESTAPDILFVSLATVRDSDLVLPEIGRALDLTGDTFDDGIRKRLSGWDGILVLDNEGVPDHDAPRSICAVLPCNPRRATAYLEASGVNA